MFFYSTACKPFKRSGICLKTKFAEKILFYSIRMMQNIHPLRYEEESK